MGALGIVMLPIKAIDTVQPIYGLTAFALLLVYAATVQTAILGPVAVVLAGKLIIDLVFHAWALRRYRRWVGDPRRGSLIGITAVAVIEPFRFRFALHVGAILGWLAFLGGGPHWGR